VGVCLSRFCDPEQTDGIHLRKEAAGGKDIQEFDSLEAMFQGLGEMKKVSQTTQFSKDVKRMRKRGKDLEKLQKLVKFLAEGTTLPANFRDHPLMGRGRHHATATLKPTGS